MGLQHERRHGNAPQEAQDNGRSPEARPGSVLVGREGQQVAHMISYSNMRILVIGLALLAAGVALYIAVTRATGRAVDSSMRGLTQVAHEVIDSVKLDTERTNARSPILWRGDTIGRLIAVGRIQYGSRPDR